MANNFLEINNVDFKAGGKTKVKNVKQKKKKNSNEFNNVVIYKMRIK